MLVSRMLSALLLHASDSIEVNHPLHAIACAAVEAIAADVSRDVLQAASSAASLSDLLFVSAAIGARAGYSLVHRVRDAHFVA
jgi:hypothetical protein